MLRKTWLVLGLGTALITMTASAEPAYIGNKKCKKCHIKQYKSWDKTKMGQAFELLKPNVRADAKKKAKLDPAKDYTSDKECLACHTVGYGKPGGYGSGEKDELRLGVGCEMCHGPGGDYTAKDKMSNKNKKFKSADLVAFGFTAKPSEAQCRVCHNKESPFYKEFNFEKRKAEGVHEHFKQKYEH